MREDQTDAFFLLLLQILSYADIVFTTVFTIEIVLKVQAPTAQIRQLFLFFLS